MENNISKPEISKNNTGFMLVDVIVGVSLMVLAFFSIFGAFQLSVEVITNSKARIGALALAQEQTESIRSLSYDEVGTVNGIPPGNILQNETITLNGVEYVRRTLIQNVDDPKDGLGILDENSITADYKSVKVEVNWSVRERTKSLILVTNIVPKGIETLVGGGTLIINVFDAIGVAIAGANVHIENNTLNPAVSIDISTNSQGKVSFPGSPSGNDYKIVVSKNGYSTARTYDITTANPNPNPGHLSVLDGKTTSVSFAIDTVSQKTVRTFSPIGDNKWKDTFDTALNISSQTNTTVAGGAVSLTNSGLGYALNGSVYSKDITPQYLSAWKNMSWQDSVPIDTNISYKLYYYNNSVLTLIPDVDLVGNSIGFTSSPVDISPLNIGTYSTIQIVGFLSTTNASTTPTILDWNIGYSSGPTPITNLPFNIRGTKNIGTDSSNNPIYKYDNDLKTGSDGTITINNLEWDNYNITINNTGIGSDISEICTPQPRSINPGVQVTTDIFLVPVSSDSLLVAVTDINGALLSNASVRLYKTGYDTTQNSSSCGQTFFPSLTPSNNYSADVSLSGYNALTISNINVTGSSTISVVLE